MTENETSTIDELSKVKKKKIRVSKTLTSSGERIISTTDLVDSGILQEINRLYLNPLGMDIRPIKGGKSKAFIIVDMSDNMNELRIKNLSSKKSMAAIEAMQELQRKMHGKRKRQCGYVIQPINE